MSYTRFITNLILLYSYPSSDKPESSFLSLLLELSLHHPHTSLRNTILSILSTLIVLREYPTPSRFSHAIKHVYSSLTSLMAEAMKNEMDEDELYLTVQVVTTLSTIIG